jgi:hypothetical protein
MRPLRLLLLLALATSMVPLFAQEQSRASHGWQRAEKQDPARGIPATQFTLTGRYLDPPRGNVQGPPSIVLSCVPPKKAGAEGRFLNGYVQAGTPLKVEFVEPSEIHGTSYFQDIAVEYHVDNEKPQNVNWSARSDKTSVALDKEAARKILRGHEVALSMEEPFESKVVLHFDIPDSTDVLNTCGIREHK